MTFPLAARLRYAWNKVAHRGTIYGAVFKRDNIISTDIGGVNCPSYGWLEARPSSDHQDLYEVKEYFYHKNLYGGWDLNRNLIGLQDSPHRLIPKKDLAALFAQREKEYLNNFEHGGEHYFVAEKQPFAAKTQSIHFTQKAK